MVIGCVVQNLEVYLTSTVVILLNIHFFIKKTVDEKESNTLYSSNGWKGSRQRDRQKVKSEE